jgi:ABC-type uncharacterized transport system ATPase subunit
MNQGKQVAHGDLNTLKLLSQGVYEVAMTFDHMPEQIDAELARLRPLRTHVDQNTIEVAFKAEEGRIMGIVTELARNRRVLRVEVNGASLEDVFVELTQGR